MIPLRDTWPTQEEKHTDTNIESLLRSLGLLKSPLRSLYSKTERRQTLYTLSFQSAFQTHTFSTKDYLDYLRKNANKNRKMQLQEV